MSDWLFDLPTALSAFLFVLLTVLASVLGASLYSWSGLARWQCETMPNSTLAVFMSIMGLFLGVIVSLIISQSNMNYNNAIAEAAQEAANIYILYSELRALDNGQALQRELLRYLEYIINVEYPELKQGILPVEGDQLVDSLVKNILAYGPQATTSEQASIWSMAVKLMQTLVSQRISRLSAAAFGVNNVIFWITFTNSLLLLMMSWFITCDRPFRYIYVTIVAIYVGAALYIMFTVPYPFRGSNAITPIPFEQTLAAIMGTSPVITTIPYKGRGCNQKTIRRR